MEKDKLVDYFSGMMISNMLLNEGITSSNIDKYTNEELTEIIRKPEKTRIWQSTGLTVLSWESFLSLAVDILRSELLVDHDHQTRSIAAIVLACMAMEELVNSHLRTCYAAAKPKLSENEILTILRKLTIKDKLDSELIRVTNHSLKIDNPTLWRIVQAALEVRNEKVHNKLPVETFSFEKKRGSRKMPEFRSLASSIIEVVPQVDEYLSSIYPEDVVRLDGELHAIWAIVKERLNWNTLSQ